MSKFIDLTGQTINQLTILNISHSDNHGKHYICLCVCGNHTTVRASRVKTGTTKSCGCLVSKSVAISNTKRIDHGLSTTSEYHIWSGIKQRCNNSNTPNYIDYGGRGITICHHWHTFSNFIYDMGSRPTPKHSIERHDNSRGYTPCNCYWATKNQQANNKRSNINIYFNGKTRTIANWARHTGLSKSTLTSRLRKYGWSIERALTTPVKPSP